MQYPYGDGCSQFHLYAKWFDIHNLSFFVAYQSGTWECVVSSPQDIDNGWTVNSGPRDNPLLAIQVGRILALEHLK